MFVFDPDVRLRGWRARSVDRGTPSDKEIKILREDERMPSQEDDSRKEEGKRSVQYCGSLFARLFAGVEDIRYR